MAKRVGQIRYYNDNNDKNYPKGLKYAQLASGSIFNNIRNITQLGIQTMPGTKIYLNNHTLPVIIGMTGIYELNVDGMSTITAIRVDAASLKIIGGNKDSYLIIDYIYEDGVE